MTSCIWVFCSLVICTLLPIWEAKGLFVDFWRELVDESGKERGSWPVILDDS